MTMLTFKAFPLDNFGARVSSNVDDWFGDVPGAALETLDQTNLLFFPNSNFMLRFHGTGLVADTVGGKERVQGAVTSVELAYSPDKGSNHLLPVASIDQLPMNYGTLDKFLAFEPVPGGGGSEQLALKSGVWDGLFAGQQDTFLDASGLFPSIDLSHPDPAPDNVNPETVTGAKMVEFRFRKIESPAGTAAETLSATEVDEDSPAGTAIGTLSATTGIAGDTNAFAFSLTQNPGGRVAIQGDKLVVAAGAVLDHETTPAFDVGIHADDAHRHALDQTFTIDVRDVDEAPTALALAGDVPLTAYRNIGAGTVVGAVVASDPDLGDTFSFSLADSSGGRFAIDNQTGVVTVADAALVDADMAVSRQIQVTVTDSGGLSLTKAFAVGLKDGAALPLKSGTPGDDTLSGAGGDFRLLGGGGDDTYRVDSAGDIVIEAANGGTDTIQTGASGPSPNVVIIPANVEQVHAGGIDKPTIVLGNSSNDRFDLDNVSEIVPITIYGGSGDDSVKLDNLAFDLTFYGGDGSDVVTSTRDPNGHVVLNGGNGNDDFKVGGGSTLIDLIGGSGDDTYEVGRFLFTPTNIVEAPNGGTDTIYGGSTGISGYMIPNNVENYFSVATGPTAGNVFGNALDNIIRGDPNGANQDNFRGMGGNDTLIGLAGNDMLDGGSGTDTAVYSGPRSAYIVTQTVGGDIRVSDTRLVGDEGTDLLSGIENIQFSDGTFALLDIINVPVDQTLVGTDGDDALVGGPGNDFVQGLGGNDILRGFGGVDYLEGGSGADALDGGAGFDLASWLGETSGLTLNLGNQSANAGSAAGDTVTNVEAFYLTNSADSFTAGSTGIFLYGFDGNDTITGSAVSDVIDGGPGADTIDAGAGFDYVSYYSSSIPVTVDLKNPANNTGDAAGDTITNAEAYILTAKDDTFVGSDTGQNIVFGYEGNDTMIGGFNANNYFIGGDGNNRMVGGGVRDLFVGGSGVDTIVPVTPMPIAGSSVFNFTAGQDKLEISRAAFGLSPTYAVNDGTTLVSGTAPVATTTDPTFFYYNDSGLFYFDPDGTAATAATLLMQFAADPATGAAPALSAGDFKLV